MPNSSAWPPSRSAWFTVMPRLVLLASFLFSMGWSLGASAEAPDVELGRSIFKKGIGRDGREIGGHIHGTLDLRGAAVACTSCHGADARGGGEAFVQASDIRWHTLTKSFAPRRVGGARPAYTRTTFDRAIYQGIASNGAVLDPAMPRFDLSQDETEALVSYLTQVSEGALAKEPPTKGVLGLLPFSHTTTFSREIGDRLTSCPSIGSSTRFPPFEILHYTDPADAISKMNARIAGGQVLSILAPYIAGWESQYVNAAKEWPVVTMLPVTPLDLPQHPTLAFAMPGLTSQVGALLDRVRTDQTVAPTILTATGIRPVHDLIEFARSEFRTRHIPFNEVDLERSDKIHPNAQWLVLVPLALMEKRLHLLRAMSGQTAFVPAMFFDPDAAERIDRHVRGITWQIAYPYQPTDTHTGRWRSPVEAWSEAGCTLMAIMAEQDEDGGITSHTSISLSSGMILTKTQDIVQHRKQVVVQKWDLPKTTK